MPILNLFGMIFEWHDAKFELVHQNRGISLEEVASVFFDDCSIDKDDFDDYDEQRTLTIGMGNQARLLVVVWTQREISFVSLRLFFQRKVKKGSTPMQDIDLEYERYKDFDFSGATRTTNPKILEMRARKKSYDRFMDFFDKEVQEIVLNHDTPEDRTRLNAVIKALYATA